MSRFCLIAATLLSLLIAACGPGDAADDFQPFDPQGDLDLQVCVTDGLGFGGADVYAEGFDGVAAGQWVTDGEGWFTIETDLNIREAGGIRFFADKGRYATQWEIAYVDTNRDEAQNFGPYCVDSSVAERAVVTSGHDYATDTLESINFPATAMSYPGPDTATDYVNVLTHPTLLREYDVMVFPSGMDEGWYEFHEDVIANLQDFVADGGSIFVSDRAYPLVEAVDPEAIDFAGEDDAWGDAQVGEAGAVEARIVDPILADALADVQVPTFDMGSEGTPWAAIAGLRDDVQVLVEAVDNETPLAVSWQPYEGGGQIVFTSIVNVGQPNGETWRVLAELMIRL